MLDCNSAEYSYVVKLIIYLKMAETQPCLQLGLPGNLEEMKYRKKTKKKMIFFSTSMIRGLDFSKLIAYTSAPFGDGELSAFTKKTLGCCLGMILCLGKDLIVL